MIGLYKKREILLGCMFFAAVNGFSQKHTQPNIRHAGYNQLPGLFPRAFLVNPPSSPLVLPDGYVRSLGYICRQEIRFDKQLPVRLRLRLGSLEQCDYLEGKSKLIR